MTFERFKELWLKSGLELPTTTDHSPRLVAALLAAANGDFSDFDDVEKRLDKRGL